MEPKPLIIVPDDPGADDLNEMLEVKVLKVFDGDGFLADAWHPTRGKWISRVPFRFAFIDAPEMDQPLGAEAGKFLHGLIAGKRVRLDLIGKQSTGYLPIDQYKRLLCMAYLTEQMPVGRTEYYRHGTCNAGVVKFPRPVTRNIELEMIINGWAWVTEQYSFDREEEYLMAQDHACRARRGLWAMDNPEPPWEFKQKRRRRQKTMKGQPTLF